jgi:hypothetical protein
MSRVVFKSSEQGQIVLFPASLDEYPKILLPAWSIK